MGSLQAKMAGDDNKDAGVEISIPVAEDPAEESNPVTAQVIADAAGDAADSAAETVNDAVDKYSAAVAKVPKAADIANRIETGTIDPNEKPKQTGEASGEATKAVNEASTCGGNCGGDKLSQVRPILEIFGTIMESVVAPVAGPCGFWVLHKALVAFAIIFFFVNLGVVLDTMANSTVTDIVLKHEKKIVYPDIYICTPAVDLFYAFKCCGETCGKTKTVGGVTSPDEAVGDYCSNSGFVSLPLEGSSEGCELGEFANYDLGRSAATSCPYTATRGQGGITEVEWDTYVNNFKLQYAGSAKLPLKTKAWVKNDKAEGLENRMPTFTPSKSGSLILSAVTGEFAVDDVVTGGSSKVTATITGVNKATLLIMTDVSCPVTVAYPEGNCDGSFTDGETLTATTGSGATGKFVRGDQDVDATPRGYRYRDTVFKPTCYYFENTGKAAATYDSPDTYLSMAFAAVMTQNILMFPPSTVAYLMETGKVPYEGSKVPTAKTGGILATKVVFPGYGNVGLGQISFDKIKDTIKGETAWTMLYDVDTTSYPVRAQNIIGSSDHEPETCTNSAVHTTASRGAEVMTAANKYAWTAAEQNECRAIAGATLHAATGTSSGFTYFNDLDQNSETHVPPGAGKCSDAAKTTKTECEIADTWTTPFRKQSYSAIDNKLWSAVSFSISNFVVREITIRDHTVAEVWAAIGGLWSGSLLILMVFFGTSDVSNAKHRFYRTFNFCCPGTRDEWLEEAGKEVANAAEEEENDKFREKIEVYFAMKAAEAEAEQTEAKKDE